MVNEQDPSVLYTLDVTAPDSSSWVQLKTSGTGLNGLLGRVGLRFVPFGSTLYAFGGYAPTPNPPNTNWPADLWGMDITSAIATGTGVWYPMSPDTTDPTNAAAAVGYPGGRAGYSWTPFQVGAVMYGGVSRTLAGGDPRECIRPTPPATTPPADCFWHQHVYGLLPGRGIPLQILNSNGFYPPGTCQVPVPSCQCPKGGCITGSSWLQMSLTGADGGPVPAGRALHSAGSMGDQVYIYGGVTAAGPVLNEMWSASREGGRARPHFARMPAPLLTRLSPPSHSPS